MTATFGASLQIVCSKTDRKTNRLQVFVETQRRESSDHDKNLMSTL
jgi:hypothetical protein